MQVGTLVVVLDREQMAIGSDDLAVLAGERIRQSAGLRALATVGATPGLGIAEVAQATVTDAKRAVDEEFQHDPGFVGDHTNLIERQFACQNDLGETHILEETCFLKRTDVGLRAGVQLDRRQVELEQPHVLDDQGVCAGIVELPDLAARLL